jgi:hypothetical protein
MRRHSLGAWTRAPASDASLRGRLRSAVVCAGELDADPDVGMLAVPLGITVRMIRADSDRLADQVAGETHGLSEGTVVAVRAEAGRGVGFEYGSTVAEYQDWKEPEDATEAPLPHWPVTSTIPYGISYTTPRECQRSPGQ